MVRLVLALLLALALVAAGCGDDDSDTNSSPAPAAQEPDEQPKEGKPSGVDIVATCAQETGQDIGSTGAPVPGFVACLKRLDAPPDVIAAWGG